MYALLLWEALGAITCTRLQSTLKTQPRFTCAAKHIPGGVPAPFTSVPKISGEAFSLGEKAAVASITPSVQTAKSNTLKKVENLRLMSIVYRRKRFEPIKTLTAPPSSSSTLTASMAVMSVTEVGWVKAKPADTKNFSGSCPCQWKKQQSD